MVDVIDDSESGYEQGGWYFDGFAVLGGELVIERILAGDEWGSEGFGGVVTCFCGHDEGAEVFGFVAGWPAEIIEDGDTGWVGSDANEIANAFVDGGGGHGVGVLGEGGGEAVCNGNRAV